MITHDGFLTLPNGVEITIEVETSIILFNNDQNRYNEIRISRPDDDREDFVIAGTHRVRLDAGKITLFQDFTRELIVPVFDIGIPESELEEVETPTTIKLQRFARPFRIATKNQIVLSRESENPYDEYLISRTGADKTWIPIMGSATLIVEGEVFLKLSERDRNKNITNMNLSTASNIRQGDVIGTLENFSHSFGDGLGEETVITHNIFISKSDLGSTSIPVPTNEELDEYTKDLGYGMFYYTGTDNKEDPVLLTVNKSKENTTIVYERTTGLTTISASDL